MEKIKNAIKPLCVPVCVTAKQGVEADFLLPDYYDTVGKLIKCSVTPYCENYLYSSGKLSISGCAEINVCYIGEDNKIYHYESKHKYTKIIPCDNISSAEAINIRQENSSLTYRVSGPKRIEIKSVIHICADIYNSETVEIISGLDEITLQHKCEKASVCHNNRYASHEIFVTNKDNQHIVNDEIRFILRKECSVELQELKPISNKLYISGNVNIRFLYISEGDFSIKQNTLNLPLSEVVDFYGIDEYSLCNVISSAATAEINIINTETKTTNIEANASISLFLHSYTKGEISFISDVYSTVNEVEASYVKCDFIQTAEKNGKTVSVSFDVESYEADNFNIIDNYIENVNIKPEVKNNKLSCLINADYNAVLKTEGGSVALVCRNNSSEFELFETMKTVRNISCRLLSISALRLNDGKIRFNADIYVDAELITVVGIDALTDINMVSDEENHNKSEIVLYFAQKNESLWDIAKENKSSVDAIKRNNEVRSEILDKDMLLIFPKF